MNLETLAERHCMSIESSKYHEDEYSFTLPQLRELIREFLESQYESRPRLEQVIIGEIISDLEEL